MKNPYFSLIQSVWHYGKAWRIWIVLYYFAYILAQSLLSLSPYALGKTIDVLQHFTASRMHEVIFWMSMNVVVIFLFWLLHGPARVKEREIALKIQQFFKSCLYSQLTHLPLKWHQDHHSGNSISRLNRSSNALYRFAGDQYLYIETIIRFFTSIGFLLWISPWVGLLTLCGCFCSIAIVFFYDRQLIPLYDQQNEIDNHVGSVLFDYISNMTTILTLRFSALTTSNLLQRMKSMWPFYKKDIIVNEVKWFWMHMTLTSLQTLILIGYVVYTLNMSGTILIGLVVMIFRYQQELSEVFFTFSAHYSELVRMHTDMDGIQPILKDIAQFAHLPEGEAVAKQWHHIRLEKLSFHHNNRNQDKSIFSNLSLDFQRGEKIALIGASGGGKSTLLNLIRGLYLPDQARLIIDGIAFPNLEPLQTITTLIPQDPEIFENTIQFNITMDVEADVSAIYYAMQLARFDSVLSILPLGLQTDIREKGLNLSVGQKQRLALARGLFAARDSSFILMDEPTSSVDLPTEKEILHSVIHAFPDATLLVSLHRLHLLPEFDRIIMLEGGEIIADGEAKRLIQEEGKVRDVWRAYMNQE